MKQNLLQWIAQQEPETIAQFGEARLVKRLNGRVELIGGSASDCARLVNRVRCFWTGRWIVAGRVGIVGREVDLLHRDSAATSGY